jgi:hypothetical protein
MTVLRCLVPPVFGAAVGHRYFSRPTSSAAAIGLQLIGRPWDEDTLSLPGRAADQVVERRKLPRAWK